MNQLHGTVSSPFEPVRDLVEAQLRGGTETGLSLAVDIDGQLVVNLWGGYSDAARTQPWQSDTITNVWSITKTVTSLAALLLADAGELDVYAPVARYWPEFAANGKQHVEVRHLLSHTSGATAHGQFLNSDTIDLIFDRQSNGSDLVNGLHQRWGIGYALPDPRTLPWIPSGRIAFWGGWGGSMAIMDLNRRMTISYVMNNTGSDILGSERARAYITAIYRALGAGGPS